MNRGYSGFYNNIFLRSSYEYAYAVYLDFFNIAWKYEEKSFTLINNRIYKPDFFIYDSIGNLMKVVEVKNRNRIEIQKALDYLEQILASKEVPAYELISYEELTALYKELPFSLTATIKSWITSDQNSINKKWNGSLNPHYNIKQNTETKKVIGDKTKQRWNDPFIKRQMLEGSIRGAAIMKERKGKWIKVPREKRHCSLCEKEFICLVSSKKVYCSDVCGGKYGFTKATEAYINIRSGVHKQIRQYVLVWCKSHPEIILNTPYNRIVTCLNPLINSINNLYNVKDIRVIIRAVMEKESGRKQLMTYLREYLSNVNENHDLLTGKPRPRP